MDKRYQVFVSSTFQDLQAERQEVMHALLELDCIPSGMELFPAADETQWSLIKRQIDDCDYYILIVAGRYGSIGSDDISFTEMEYRHALEIGKPIIAFLHKNPGKIPSEYSEQSLEGREKLRLFRERIQQRLCKLWETPSELGSVVSRSLVQLIKASPAIGWVRANELSSPETNLELLKLRRQIDELKAEIEKSKTSGPEGSNELAQGEDIVTVRYDFYAQLKGTYERDIWKEDLDLSWDDIFGTIGPLMIHEANEFALTEALNRMIDEWSRNALDEQYPQLNEAILTDFEIEKNDFDTIKIQLRALGLITEKNRKDHWTLTPHGDRVMTRLRAIRKPKIIDPGN